MLNIPTQALKDLDDSFVSRETFTRNIENHFLTKRIYIAQEAFDVLQALFSTFSLAHTDWYDKKID